MSSEVDPSTVKPSDETVALANMWLRLCETLQQRTQLSQAWTPDYRNCEIISASSFLNSVLFFMGVSLIYNAVLVSDVQQSDLVMSDSEQPYELWPSRLLIHRILQARTLEWVAKPPNDTYTYTHSFSDSFLIQVITEHWAEFPVLYTVGPCWFLIHTKSCATLTTWSKEPSP